MALSGSKLDGYINKKTAATKASSMNTTKTINIKGKQKSKHRNWKKILLISSGVFALLVIIASSVLAYKIIQYSKQLPPPGKPFAKDIAQNTNIYDKTGTVLLASLHGTVNRKWVKLSDIDNNMKYAMLSAEDINFYHEPGIDILGIARAVLRDVFSHGSNLQGASTISQQLVKNVDLSSTQTFDRKIKEVILTIEIERQYSKDQILEAYFNEISFGGDTSGLKVESEELFNVEPDKLDLAQSALLAALPQNPSIYSPIHGYDPKETDGNLASTDRAYYVLNQMLIHKSITGVTADQVAAAKKEVKGFETTITGTASTNLSSTGYKAPHFVEYVKSLLIRDYGASAANMGLQVTTSLDYNLQQIGEAELEREWSDLNNKYKFSGDDSAMMSLDPKTGEILAMVGSPKNVTDINILTDSNGVQPGSSIKPMLYVSAFKNLGYAPSTFMPDIPISIPDIGSGTDYKPTNDENNNIGVVNIDTALSNSLNTSAVETLYTLGLKNFLSDLLTWGYSTADPAHTENAGLSYAIGGGSVVLKDHIAAYGMLANGGTLYPATSILKINDSTGKNLYTYDPSKAGKRVVDSAYTYMIDKTLEHYKYLLSVGKRFTPSLFTSGYDIAGKTGTNNTVDKKGNEGNASSITFVGYTPDLVTGFWYGNQANQGKPLTTNGGYIPQGEYLIPYWGDYMQKVLPKFPKDSFTRPSNIVDRKICTDSGLLFDDTKSQCGSTTAIFEKDHIPKYDDTHVVKQVCQSDNSKLATAQMIASGQSTTKTFTSLKTMDPFFQSQLDAFMKDSNTVPTQYCTSDTGLSVGITSPQDQTVYNANNVVNVTANAVMINSSNTIANLDLYFNNNKVTSLSVDPNNAQNYTGSFTIPAGTANGSYQLTVKAFDNTGTEKDTSIALNIGQASSQNNKNAPVSNSKVTISNPISGQVVVPGNGFQLKLNTTNSVDPNHVQSAYFNIFSDGQPLDTNVAAQRDSTDNTLWSSSYNFKSVPNGYYIQGCIMVQGDPNPECASVVASHS